MKGIYQTKRLLNAYNPKFTGGSYAGNVYDPSYLSPALNTMGGGGRQPFILEVYEIHPRLHQEQPLERDGGEASSQRGV